MRNFFNLPQAGFGAKGKRWSPRKGVSTGRITRSRRSDNTETPNALSFRNAAAGLLPAPIRLIAISPLECDERINGLMPRQQLAHPGHLHEADLHNFTDLFPPVAFAVL